MTPTLTIATLTLNPALDLATATDKVVHTDKLRCETGRYDPGGGGVNVARAITTLGGYSIAVFPAGGPNGIRLRRLVEAFPFDAVVIPIEGETRLSFSAFEKSSNRQFRFVLPGPRLSPEEQQECLSAIGSLQPRPAAIVVSGTFPPGVASDYLSRLGDLAANLGARLFLDTSGPALQAATNAGVYLVKPNLRELSAFVGRLLEGSEMQIDAAREMLSRFGAEVVVVSLGADGAIMVTADGAEILPAPEVEVRSSVGAGDSMMGAMVLRIVTGCRLRDAVIYGLAAGSAALLTDGTELCRREDTERLYAELNGSFAGQ
jgi:6-phosphofructokinase 2